MEIPDPPLSGKPRQKREPRPRQPEPESESTPFVPPPESTERFKPIAATAPPSEWKLRTPASAGRRVLLEIALRLQEPIGPRGLWTPMPQQAPFHSSMKHVRMALGGQRGGKTLVACAEVSRALLGCDPFNKYPKRNGIAAFLAKDNSTASTTFNRKLLQPGAIQLIRDEQTRLWRAVRPGAEYDEAYREKWKDAPPFIPERLCDRDADIAWEDKKLGVLSRIKIPSTGWEAYVFSAESHAKTGYEIDLAWMDEEAKSGDWYEEFEGRAMSRKGRIIITTTPLLGTEWLCGLHNRFQAGDPLVDAIYLDQDSNIFIDAGARAAAQASYDTPEKYALRVKGHFQQARQRVFPEFDPSVHGMKSFEIPPHWTRYCMIDPGNVPATAVFIAVPPPDDTDHGEHVYLYAELVLHPCPGADAFAKALKPLVGPYPIERFIIDMRMSRQSEAGSGWTTLRHYQEAFARHGLESERQGADFTAGCDDPWVRIEAMHEWLRGGTHSKLRYFDDVVFIFPDQMKRYSHKRDPKGNITREIIKKNDHAVDCACYGAAHGLSWHPPGGGSFTSPWKKFQEMMRGKLSSFSSGFSFGPRGAT